MSDPRSKQEDFEMAVKAFRLFTEYEQRAALVEFSRLHYPSVEEKFFEAVHRVITRDDKLTPEPPDAD
jgi:hypothetical protein